LLFSAAPVAPGLRLVAPKPVFAVSSSRFTAALFAPETALVFVLSYVFWEFFTPFNQFGEPLRLLVLELGLWDAIALGEGFVIAWAMEWRPNS